jgi:hypothetical protein
MKGKRSSHGIFGREKARKVGVAIGDARPDVSYPFNSHSNVYVNPRTQSE